MAIAPTGAIYKSLVFDGESSRDYGIYITGQAVYNAPERDVEMISIPGRNGSFALDKGRFQNIEVTYPAGIFADNEADFAQGISDFRNFLCSRNGYVRLTDDYNPDEYRMAVYKSGLDVSPAQLRAGEFQIVFDCKPQRYLTSGEEPITIGEWHETETASGEIASFEAKDGDAVKSLVADITPIQSLNGYDKPWSGGAGANKWDEEWETGIINGITGEPTPNANRIRSKNFIKVLPSTTYYCYFGSATVGISAHFYTDSYEYLASASSVNIKNRTFTTPSNAGYMKFNTASADLSTYNHDIAINYPSSVTTYSPYSNICPISGYDSVVVSRCDVNVWDEEYKQGYYNSAGTFVSANNQICTKNMIQVVPSTTYYLHIPVAEALNVALFEFDASGTLLRRTTPFTPSNRLFTTTENSKFILLNFHSEYGATYNHDISINYPSTDHEYHAYNGTTYTTDLNGTRYGGTLDVVSGVLTDKMGMVDLGTLSWSYNSSNGFFYANVVGGVTNLGIYVMPNILCSIYKTDVSKFGADFPSAENGIVTWSRDSSQVQIKNTAYTDATSFKTAMDGVQLCYELATPTTVQLTAQEVELLVGLNNVWANSGDVSVEYGTAPNVVINPTLFESSPMLEVEGYGTIAFNGYEIELTNDVIGDVLLLGATNNKTSIYYDGSLVNTNDVVTIHDHRNLRFRTNVTTASYTPTSATLTRTTSNIPGTFSYTATLDGRNFVIDLFYLGNDTFSYGTTSSKQDTFTLSIGYTNGNTSGTLTRTFNVTQRATSRYVQTYSTEDTSGGIQIYGSRCSYGEITAYSTQTILGHPTYVECDIGVCYKEVDGEAVSLNQYIDLGSDLPRFASGANTITADNTVTDLKVVPRWWKI